MTQGTCAEQLADHGHDAAGYHVKCLTDEEVMPHVGHHHSLYELSGFDACDPATNSTPPSFPLTNTMADAPIYSDARLPMAAFFAALLLSA